jgi:hypothetical protein
MKTKPHTAIATVGSSMIQCHGCGFHVEPEDVRELAEYTTDRCLTCKNCELEPRLKESYRRGFNAGLDALAKAVVHTAQYSGLRKSSL